jgi:hypothetical protein
MYSLKSGSFNRFNVLIVFCLSALSLALNAGTSKEKDLADIQQEIKQRLFQYVDSKKLDALRKEAESPYVKKGQVITVQTRFGKVTGKYNGWYGDKIIIGRKSIYKFDVSQSDRKKLEASQSDSDEAYNKLVEAEFKKLRRGYYSEIKKLHLANTEKKVYNKHGYYWNAKTKEWVNQANLKEELAEASLAIKNMKSPHSVYMKIRNIPYNYPSIRNTKEVKEKFLRMKTFVLKEVEKEVSYAVTKAEKSSKYSEAIAILGVAVRKYSYAPNIQTAINKLNTYVSTYNKRKELKKKASENWLKYNRKFVSCPYCQGKQRNPVCFYCKNYGAVVQHSKSKFWDCLAKRMVYDISPVNLRKYKDRYLKPDNKKEEEKK